MAEEDDSVFDGNSTDEDLGDIALSSVDEALSAVENQEAPVPETPVAKPASNVIPELDDVDDPDEMVQVLLTVGEERSRHGDVKGALAAFNKAIALDPSCDMAWFNRGVLLEAQQDARGARQSFQICLDLNEHHAPATANMAILLERIGDLEGAYDMAQRALGFFPGHPALVELQSRCKDSDISVPMETMQPSVQVTQTVDMDVVAEIAEEAGIEDPEVLLQEAVHHDHDADDELSEEELKSAAELVVAQQEVIKEMEQHQAVAEHEPEQALDAVPEPEEDVIDMDLLVEEATQRLKDGDPKSALAILKPHLKTIAAAHAGAWRIAGGAMARLELDHHAIAAMTHAQNLEPGHASGWFNLGSIHQRSGNVKEALESYKRAVGADPTYLKAAEKMLALAEEQGLIERYLEAARMVLTIDGNHDVRGQLVNMLLSLAQGESHVLEQASGLPPTLPAGPEMAAEALSYLPSEPSPQRALGLSLIQQHGDSVLMWKSLIQAEPSEASHWIGLARALEQAGDLETAAKCHAKAASMNGELASPVQVSEPEPQPGLEQQAAYETYGDTFGEESALAATADLSLGQMDAIQQPYDLLGADDEPMEMAQADLLLTPLSQEISMSVPESRPDVDLAKAALDAAQAVAVNTPQSTSSKAISNQDVAWFNQGVQLIDDKKYREALSCFDKALPAFAGDDAMIIRILNNRGNAYYFLEEYPKCVESYHQAMLIRPTEVRGETLYNMGTAYAEMERYNDAIKCFEQAIPRGLSEEAKRRAKDQIRRCNILQKAVDKKRKRR
jgi:tetratricopeptide (TPR) repeat protein